MRYGEGLKKLGLFFEKMGWLKNDWM